MRYGCISARCVYLWYSACSLVPIAIDIDNDSDIAYLGVIFHLANIQLTVLADSNVVSGLSRMLKEHILFWVNLSPLGQKRVSDGRVVSNTSNVHTHAHVIWHERPAYHCVYHLSSTCQTDDLLKMTDRLQTKMYSSNIQATRICPCIFVCMCDQALCLFVWIGEKWSICKKQNERLRGNYFFLSRGGSKNLCRKQQ